jgi:hypothetical protein
LFVFVALESALDQHAIHFLSSNEAQRCIFALWKGLLVQKAKDGENGSIIEYQLYKGADTSSGFLSSFNADRIGVPRYQVSCSSVDYPGFPISFSSSHLTSVSFEQFYFRIWLWLVFIAAYTVAIQTPDRGFGLEDIVLYIQVLGYMVEDLVKVNS